MAHSHHYLIAASIFLEADSAVHAHCRLASSLLLKIHTSLCGLWICWVLHLEERETCPMRYALISWTIYGITRHSWDACLPFEMLIVVCGRQRHMSHEVWFNIMDNSWHDTALMEFIHSHDES